MLGQRHSCLYFTDDALTFRPAVSEPLQFRRLLGTCWWIKQILHQDFYLHSMTWSWRSPSHSLCGRKDGWSYDWRISHHLCNWWSLTWPVRDMTMTWTENTRDCPSVAQWEEMPLLFKYYALFLKNQIEVHTWSLIQRCIGGKSPRSSGAAGQGRTVASPWSSTAGFWQSMMGWAPTHSGGWIVPPHSGRSPRTASWCLEGRKVRQNLNSEE